MRAFTVTVYVLFGVLALGAGVVALAMPGVIISEASSSPLFYLFARRRSA